jgi:hypothetical protein
MEAAEKNIRKIKVLIVILIVVSCAFFQTFQFIGPLIARSDIAVMQVKNLRQFFHKSHFNCL